MHPETSDTTTTTQQSTNTTHSRGGGRGTYGAVDGDMPKCFLQPRQLTLASTPQQPLTTDTVVTQHYRDTTDFVVFHKNARGLSNNDRLAELLIELEPLRWDIVTLNETMRTTTEESWVTEGEHLFLGSGYTEHTRGVAILVHRRWRKHVKQFQAISERVAAVDIQRGKFKIRIVSAYFPHSGYNDTHIQQMYDTLTFLNQEATKANMHFALGADCNARVGTATEDDDHNTLGHYALNPCNARGQWLKNWAAMQRLTITNTFFRKQDHKLVTYTGPNGIPRQLDYILVNRRFWKTVRDCESTKAVDLGSDHDALRLRSTALIQPTTKLRPSTTKPSMTTTKRMTWPPMDTTLYQTSLSTKLDDLLTSSQLELKCEQIENAIQMAMREQPSTPTTTKRRLTNNRLTQLIDERRNTTSRDSATKGRLSKQIQREIRAIKRTIRRAEITSILKEYRELNRISGIKSQKKKELIPRMTDHTGKAQHDRQSIADVFATFYERLYADPHRHGCQDIGTAGIPSFTFSELSKGLKQLKTGKAADTSGLLAEMLKQGGNTIRSALLTLYNTISQPNAPSPTTWHHTLIKVLHKSGDKTLPGNYRPIATIPLLYKLYARLLYNRLEPTLDAQQSCDQAGFRRQRGTTDHLFTITAIQEIADEWQIPLWVAAVDFKKAFDSVTHEAIWIALQEQGVTAAYISLLAKLYDHQTAAVKTDCTSRCFNIERGTKQGDPLSSLLFNCVSESVMRRVKAKWSEKHIGLPLQPHHTPTNTLTNLRFADDILLVATSLRQVSDMIADLSIEAGKVGLQLHPDKTNILHNNCHATTGTRRRIPNNVRVLDMTIAILPARDATKYLGRQLGFSNPHELEIESRISQAWRKFYKFKQELTGSRYPLAERLRLFHGTVTPTILYGCEAWTMTGILENRLRRTQRQMLRMILHAPRRHTNTSATHDNYDHVHTTQQQGQQQQLQLQTQPQQPQQQQSSIPQHLTEAATTISSGDVDEDDDDDDDADVDSTTSTPPPPPNHNDANDDDLEPWVEWIRRCTYDVEAKMRKLKLDDWTTMQRRRKWRWAHKVAMAPRCDWMAMAIRWDPTCDPKLNARRRQGRPKRRWTDDIVYHLAANITTMTDLEQRVAQVDKQLWCELAQDKLKWSAMEESFCQR
jgi:hypothetical protein